MRDHNFKTLKGMLTLGFGIVMGLALASPAAYAVDAFLKAFPSTQTFYVDGQQVELEAYAINGHNYVKLRDIGETVGFNVYYDAELNAAMMESGQPYTGEASKVDVASPGNDHSAQANPAIFTEELTREAYNAIRHSIVNWEAILSGAEKPIPFWAKPSADGPLNTAVPTLGFYPGYYLITDAGGNMRCDVRKLPVYDGAVEHTQVFLDSISTLSARDQVDRIVWYVCDRLTYSVQYPFVDEVLTQDREIPGCCAAYAYSVKFLCDRANIPCILVSSDTHEWNRVYVDGRWWDVDATGDDVPDLSFRSQMIILHPLGEKVGGLYEDYAPDSTFLSMELLVPGSTK